MDESAERIGLLPTYPSAICLAISMLSVAAWANGAPIISSRQSVQWLGRFDPAQEEIPAPWQLLRFDQDIPPTRYSLRDVDGTGAVHADAHASMALLARPLQIDLSATPVLCWRWRIDAVVQDADLDQKSGDDYAARVYVAFDIPNEQMSLGLRTKLKMGRMLFGDQLPDAAINYVWDNRHPVGTRAPNAYTDRTQMIVARSGNDDAGHQWQSERHNVLLDAHAAFPGVTLNAVLLAIGSDTDNTGATASAAFADLHFVGVDQPCAFGPAG